MLSEEYDSLLSEYDFHRLMSDPRLGKVRMFFKPIDYHRSLIATNTTTNLDKQKNTRKLKRCNDCLICRMPDCGKCIACSDKPKFGGSGIRKQSCNQRPICQTFTKILDVSTTVVSQPITAQVIQKQSANIPVAFPALQAVHVTKVLGTKVLPPLAVQQQCFARHGKHRKHTCIKDNTAYDAINAESVASSPSTPTLLAIAGRLTQPLVLNH